MHWSDDIVEALKARGGDHVIETGTSISGIPHLGNASDVIRGDCVRKACVDAGLSASLIWVADDSDPFRKVPVGMEELSDYLGFPVKDIPAPGGAEGSLVSHLADPFLEDLKAYGIEPVRYSGTDLYRSGALLDQIKIAFSKRDKVREILNKFRRDELPSDWVPWTPICSVCGRISTTKVTSVSGLKASYICETTDISGGTAQGCGHEGVSDAETGMGKLPWRVEWAARWAHFAVTCEPFGKDHAVAGASYETSSIISEEIFGWKAPVPVVYEFFTLNGAKISSSKGNVLTLSDWLAIAEPEVLKYFMYKRLAKARDINLRMLPNLVDEYDICEREWFSKGNDYNKIRMYELSQVTEPAYLNVPFTLCGVLSQVANDDELAPKVSAMGYEGFDEKRLAERVRLAGKWVSTYGPEYLRFKIHDDKTAWATFNALPDTHKIALKKLAELVGTVTDPKVMHKSIYETARGEGIDPKELFTSIYQVLIGKEKGPKAAAFLQSLGKEMLERKFGQ